MMNKVAFRAAVVGATGYTGQEMIRLLQRHPRISTAVATSESEAGRPVRGTSLRYTPVAELDFGAVDIVFACLPTGESGAWALRAQEAGVRAIDLSADLRHGVPDAVYGVPELWREEVRHARLVANPGCYPTGLLLALAPLIGADLVDLARPVIANAASGVTGAGRGAKRDMLFAEVAEDYRAYGVGNTHRHVPEIAAGLNRLARTAAGAGATPVSFVFTPHLLPVRRGILETLYIPLAAGVTAADLTHHAAARYADERFVTVWSEGLPSLKDVVNTNEVAMGFAGVTLDGAPLALGVVAFDNLLKGAAGQAVQNANLMLGLCEQEGLGA
jgi:N-acetyl-gamma-glutamyl-phosphate reductase